MAEQPESIAGAADSSGFVPELPRRTYTFPGVSDQMARVRPDASQTDDRLTVGRGVRITGTIEKCLSLIVEGVAEVSLEGCQSFELAESGVYSGRIVADIAVIAGSFEGTLVARESLSVQATGRIKGVVRFKGIEIQPGGQIEGEMHPLSAETPAADAAGA